MKIFGVRLFERRYDGGSDSQVTGFWVIEWKSLFSIVLLRFNPNKIENFHSSAFNAHTFWLKGGVIEESLNLKTGATVDQPFQAPSYKYTPREKIHKIHAIKPAFALCIRGPWHDTWQEYDVYRREVITLTHGRQVVSTKPLRFS